MHYSNMDSQTLCRDVFVKDLCRRQQCCLAALQKADTFRFFMYGGALS